MPIDGLRFGHVAFCISDVERSVRWYGEAFGAKKIYHAQAQGDRPELMFLEFARGQCVELFPGGKNVLPSPSDPSATYISASSSITWSRRWRISPR